MAVAEISDWLNSNGPFLQGVALLKKHGKPNGTDLFLYGRPENSVLRERLRGQLSALIEPLVATLKQETAAITPKRDAAPVKSVDRISEDRALSSEPKQDLTEAMLPAQLRPLRQELKQMYATLTFLRGGLPRIPDGMELRRTAEKVAKLHAKMKAGWFILETWRATGTIPDLDTKPEPIVGEMNMIKRRNALRSYLSKAKKGKRTYSAEKLAGFYKELVELDRRLDGTA